MRSLMVLIFLILFFIIGLVFSLTLLIIGVFDPNLKNRVAQKIVRIACKIILFLSGVKLTVIGEDNIPEEEGVLFVMNHRSYFDIVAFFASTSKLTTFIAKRELKYFPFLNIWMKILNCLFLDRNDVRKAMTTILEGIKLIKSGYSIAIAPEGTRNSEKEMLPFKEGSFKFATKTGCPIIPLSINNADSVFEKQSPNIKKAHVIIEYGEPVYVNELDKRTQSHIGRYIQGLIKQTLDKNEASLEF